MENVDYFCLESKNIDEFSYAEQPLLTKDDFESFGERKPCTIRGLTLKKPNPKYYDSMVRHWVFNGDQTEFRKHYPSLVINVQENINQRQVTVLQKVFSFKNKDGFDAACLAITKCYFSGLPYQLSYLELFKRNLPKWDCVLRILEKDIENIKDSL